MPRTDNGQASLKGENVNVKFKELCAATDKVKFCDNDGSFRLADGSPNDALLMPHGNILNYRGSEKLAKNLGLPTKIRRNQRSQSRWTPRVNNYSIAHSVQTPPLLPTPLQFRNNANNTWN